MQLAPWAPFLNREETDFFSSRVDLGCYVNNVLYGSTTRDLRQQEIRRGRHPFEVGRTAKAAWVIAPIHGAWTLQSARRSSAVI